MPAITEPWDLAKKYKIGDTALVNGVEAIVLSNNGTYVTCGNCPTYTNDGLQRCPGGGPCEASIGPNTRWHPLKEYVLRRLRGGA